MLKQEFLKAYPPPPLICILKNHRPFSLILKILPPTRNTGPLLGINNEQSLKADLVRGHEEWQNWDFPRLIKALKTWKEINPLESNAENLEKPGVKFCGRKNTFQTKETMPTQRACVYCEVTDHRSVNCDKFVTVEDRKK